MSTFLLFLLSSPGALYAADPEWSVKTIFGEVNSDMALNQYLAITLNFIYSIIGTVTLVRVLYGAYRYMSASGNAQEAKLAKDTIIHALTGLALVLIAYLLTRLFFDENNTLILNSTNSPAP